MFAGKMHKYLSVNSFDHIRFRKKSEEKMFEDFMKLRRKENYSPGNLKAYTLVCTV